MVDLQSLGELPLVAKLRDLIRRWWGLELALADERGYVLDHAEGKIIPSANAFCREALFSKEGFKHCNDSVRLVRDRLRNRRKSRVQVHACHLGFDIVAAPLRIDNSLIGFVFTGGSIHKPPTLTSAQDLVRRMRDLGGVENAAVREQQVGAIPQLSAAELEHLSDLVEMAAQEITRAYLERRATAGATTSGRDRAKRVFGDIVGQSQAMTRVFDLLTKVARSESTVLIHGESGTGKELIARAIHDNGPRAKQPFVVQNCSAFNDSLLESALFGHVRGSFTGAVKDHKGLFETADGGTFFLDEVGDMSAALQVKLLRVLQEGTLMPVGSNKPVTVNVRIIAASHKDLARMVERGEFREDLYYRLNVLKVVVPPLRERMDDLPILVQHFLAKHSRGDRAPTLSAAAMAALSCYRWPGNIRELENEIERLTVLGGDDLEFGADLLSPRIRDAQDPTDGAASPRGQAMAPPGATLREAVESVEADLIAKGLIRTHWNKSQLAKELGISRSNLVQKCIYYGIDRKES